MHPAFVASQFFREHQGTSALKALLVTAVRKELCCKTEKETQQKDTEGGAKGVERKPERSERGHWIGDLRSHRPPRYWATS